VSLWSSAGEGPRGADSLFSAVSTNPRWSSLTPCPAEPARCRLRSEAAGPLTHPWTERLPCFEAMVRRRGIDADAFACAMIEGHKVRMPAEPGRPESGPARQAGGRTRRTPFNRAQLASVGSTEASDGGLARFGVVDRSVERSPCARRSDRPKRRAVALRPAVGSPEASASLLARVGVVGPKRARPLQGQV
jgi:hypothetical protein